ncbi:MAG: ABC transporter permease [Desulfobulbaceae bacterium]|nr:ABC transporter permease [Desulfobulbaceae bacterium]
MNKLWIILSDTLQDQLKRKSFYVLLTLSVLIVLTLRGCYNVNYTVNNQTIDPASIARHASLFAFHLITVSVLLMAVLLSMRMFQNDRQDGTMIMYMSRPISRWQYGFGRVAGVWLLTSLFMFCLHATIFAIAWAKSGEILYGYLVASVICTINIFFVILLTSLLSFFMPGFICAMTVTALVTVGFLSDGGLRIANSQIVKSMLTHPSTQAPSIWRIFYPKLLMVQQYAATFFNRDNFQAIGPVHPVVNVFLYSLALLIVFLLVVDRQEV